MILAGQKPSATPTRWLSRSRANRMERSGKYEYLSHGILREIDPKVLFRASNPGEKRKFWAQGLLLYYPISDMRSSGVRAHG